MVEKKEDVIVEQGNFLDDLKFRYVPYWPLFAILLILFLFLAFLYIKYRVVPVYVVTATLVINDEQKGVDQGQSVRSLNTFAANKIVENEVQVLGSRTLITAVVRNLYLYAPVSEKEHSAYVTSPVLVEAKDPDRLKEQKDIAFDYDYTANSVKIEKRHYPLNQWLAFPFGTIRFIPNTNRSQKSLGPFYFSLVNPRVVAAGLAGALKVSAVSKLSSVVTITYTDPVPERGKNIVNELLKVYHQASQSYNQQVAANTLAFVENRLRNVERELDSIEGRVQQFKSQQGVVDLSEQGRIYLQNVAENDRKATDINMQLAILDQVERYVQSNRRTGIVPTTLGINDPVLVDLLQRLNQLELEYANLRTTVPENNAEARSLANEIQKIRPNILSIVQNQRSRLSASRNNLNNSSGRYSSMIRSIPQQERALLEISRQQAIKNEVYSFLLQRREEAAVSNAATLSDSRIVDRAEAGIVPVASGKMVALAGAFAAAFALGILAILLKEGWSRRVLFRSHLEESTPFPVVGEIINRRYRKNFFERTASDAVLARGFTRLQASIGLFEEVPAHKCFLVTSSLPREGKTFVSNLFAIHLAASGKKVVLIDLNLHDHKTSGLHNIPDADGFTEFIHDAIDASAVIRRTAFANLDVVAAGSKTGKPMELFLHPKTTLLFQHLKQAYDYVIIDSPPVELATDAFALSRYCDTTLFVVRHGVTPKSSLIRLGESSMEKSFPKLGLIFNGVKPRGFLLRYFGYGYGYGFEKVFRKNYYPRPGG